MERTLSTLSTSLAGSETWFRSLADTAASAIFVYREKFLYVNEAAEQLSGYSAAELREMHVWEIIHPDFRDLVRERVAARLRGEQVVARYELKAIRKNGEERWIDFAAGVIDVDGKPAAVGTAFDVTERKLAEIALAESQERLNLAQRAAHSLSWEWSAETDELEFSEYANELLGFPAHKMIRTGEDLLKFIHPDDRERSRRALVKTLKTGSDQSIEIRCVSPKGDVRWLAMRALAVREESGRTKKVIGIAHDVTERKIAEDALFQEKERALVTLASIADGVIRTDADGAVDYLNPVAQKLTGWTLAEAYGRPIGEIYRVVDEATGKPSLNPVDRCLQEQRNVVYPGDRHLLHRDAREFPIHDSAAPIRNRQGFLIGAILVFKDLSQLREVEREMVHLASHDVLTGLINRREFEDRLAEALQSAREERRRHALCYMDLDQFKLVNDTCGHSAGDQMILQIASLLASMLRDKDVLARLGGDEFGLLLRDCSSAEARRLVDEIAEAIRNFRFSWHDRLFSIGVSGGLVPITQDSPDLASLLSAADAACYVAKESGANRIHDYQPGDKAVAERYGEMQWISRIHKAFDEERFSIYHQAIRSLNGSASERPLSELFIRLRDESGRLVGPDSFIPAAERYGLISAIDRWVIRAALDRLSSQNGRQALDYRFAINVSGQSLGEEGFLDFVVEQFERTGVEPARIHFEITETSAIADLPHAMRFIAVLKRMGCRFVLDDFGKGLSSFSYLQNLPVDFLKIDGGFVRNLTSDPIQAALVASIHEIGHVMGLATIAESVEDNETLEALKKIGVDYVQGFLFSKPEPLDVFPPGE